MVCTQPATQSPRPFLKWAGGKGRLIEQYRPFLPRKIDRYFEPFLGGGAMFFHLSDRLQFPVLSDLNPELVNAYLCVQQQVERVIEHLRLHAKHHSSDYYYQIRAQTDLACPTQRAARFLYLNKTCFNGLYRENAKGLFNVPIGRYQNPRICPADLLRAASEALQGALIMEASFACLPQFAWQPGDFVYFDPPYHPISKLGNFARYTRHGFTAADQVQLRDVVKALVGWGVKVMVSNSDCDFIREIYQGFHIHQVQVNRAINSKGGGRGPINEVVITSYAKERRRSRSHR